MSAELSTQSELLIPTRAEYAAVMGDVRDVLGLRDEPDREESTFGRDFHRVVRGDHLLLNPAAVDPLDLDDTDFNRVAQRFGPDMFRVRAIPASLIATPDDMKCLPAGGSCAIETWGLRIINFMKSQRDVGNTDDSAIAQIAGRILDMGPTVSHVSGAMLSGAGRDNVHYVESRLWTDTVTALGVEDAPERVAALYARINQVVARRAALINPDTVMHFVDFDELGLDNAAAELMAEIGVDYDPNFGTAQVLYTYIGSQLLGRVQGAIERQVAEGRSTGLSDDYHVVGRFKQVDHNGWDSMPLPAEVIKGERPFDYEERIMAEDSFPYRFGVALGRRMVQTEGDIHQRNAVVAGFMDLPLGGELVHMQPNLRQTDRLSGNLDAEGLHINLERILNDPRRLHHGNFEEHMAYLELSINPEATTIRQQLIDRKQAITNQLKPMHVRKAQLEGVLQSSGSNVAVLESRIVSAENLAGYVGEILLDKDTDGANEVPIAVDVANQRDAGIIALLQRMSTLWTPIDQRLKSGGELTDLDRADIEELEFLYEAAMGSIMENRDKLIPLLQVYESRVEQVIATARQQIASIQAEVDQLKAAPVKQGQEGVVTSKIDSKNRVADMRKAELSIQVASLGFIRHVIVGNEDVELSHADILRGMIPVINRSQQGKDAEKDALRSIVDKALHQAAPSAKRLLVQFAQEARVLVDDSNQRIVRLIQERENATMEIEAIKQDVNPLRREHDKIALAIVDMPKPFPLNENLIISHALQFLWDPDFRAFLSDVRKIKNAGLPKPDAEAKLREAMGRILPKLHAYYAFIFGRIDERPSTERMYAGVV